MLHEYDQVSTPSLYHDPLLTLADSFILTALNNNSALMPMLVWLQLLYRMSDWNFFSSIGEYGAACFAGANGQLSKSQI
jgi:hypothetical protein